MAYKPTGWPPARSGMILRLGEKRGRWPETKKDKKNHNKPVNPDQKLKINNESIP
jgi:hypothetical protein